MKDVMKNRIVAFLLVVCVCITMLFAASTVPASAKAKPKLSAKSVVVVMGGAKKVTLKNGKGKWIIQGNGVARLKSKKKTSVTIVPLKAGDTVVTCKVGKKKLSCKVKVLNSRIGDPKEDKLAYLLEGKTATFSLPVPDGVSVSSVACSNGKASASHRVYYDSRAAENILEITVRPKSPGRFDLIIYPADGSASVNRMFVIKNFRGKAKAKKNKSNYNKWRRQFMLSAAHTDMSTWEIIHSAGFLISSGRYSGKGGSTGIQLWYGSNGTCVSGAKMMSDFMNDVGVKNKVKFAGKMKGPVDIFGANLMYGVQHRNIRIKLGGKVYELNPQPGFEWPYGIVKRKSL